MDAQRLQSVGRLAGGVAHEVNNNMTVVLGLGEIVLEALGPDHPEGRDLKAMLEAGARAARISQQLLTFTRQQFTQPRRLDLYAVITRLEPMLRSLVGNDKNLVIAPDQKAAPISADLPQVEQVLVALITNARDATPAGGQVTVSVDDVALSGEETVERGVLTWPGDYVRLVVSDTGAGMDSETLARVFDPFFTTKPVGVGTGLGLSMVYGVVKRHEGYIGVDSAPGQGTTLRLYWPALELDSREDSGAAPAFPQRRSGEHTTRVWVVEDEAPVRELLARTLKAEGFRVVTADNGAHALQLLHDEPDAPDIVITDLVMPVVNGRQVSEAVATRYPDVPVLFMSGYSVDEVVRLGLLSARAAFLQKPFTPTQLVDALEAMLAPAG
jgi:two-component system, cell cycle sensor histidine kinase and response regulator CckA